MKYSSTSFRRGDIQKRYLQRHYGNPDLSKLQCIGIDEFAVAKGHIYKTIAVNLLTGRRSAYRKEKDLNKRGILAIHEKTTHLLDEPNYRGRI